MIERKGTVPLLPRACRNRPAACRGLASSVGALYFITAVVILHLLRPDLNPVTHAVSNYAVGPFGLLMTSAFFILAMSEFALAQGLVRGLARSGKACASVLLLHMAAAGLMVTGLFHSDVDVPRPPASPGALVHWIGAGISFLSLMISIFLLSACFKHDTRWRAIYRLSYIWGVAIVLALATYGALAIVGWTGIGERIYIAISVLWLLFVSLRLRSIS